VGRESHGQKHLVQNDRLHVAINLHVLNLCHMDQVDRVKILRDLGVIGMTGQLEHPSRQADDPIGFGTLTGDCVQIVGVAQFTKIIMR
jgi:hypothetical protein